MSDLIFEKSFDFGSFQTWNGKPPFECFRIHQVHGIDFNREQDEKKADGICGHQSQPWAIVTADCLPVVIHGAKGDCFFHAGWRGIADQIFLQNEVQSIEPQYAFIGPHINQANFEVQEDFKASFPGSRHFHQDNQGRVTFDLLGEITEGLQKAYKGIIVEDANLCTFNNTSLNSYRLDKTQKRNWNVFTSKAIQL